MTLPVSSYEELLARVRSLTSETLQLRREITLSLYDESNVGEFKRNNEGNNRNVIENYATYPQSRSSTIEELITHTQNATNSSAVTDNCNETRPFLTKEESANGELKDVDERTSSPEFPVNSNFRDDWGPESLGLWHSGPCNLSLGQTQSHNISQQNDSSGVTSSLCLKEHSFDTFSSQSRAYSHQQLGAKVEMVYNLISMLGTNNREDMSKTFLAMSSSPDSCHAMRQSGCLPLLVQLIHSSELDFDVRSRAAEALQNIVYSQFDEKRKRREIRVLKLLQQIREYGNDLRAACSKEPAIVQDKTSKHPVAAVGALMKYSFDAEHRQAICTLGGLHAITELIQLDHEVHGSKCDDIDCLTLRRYAGMSLTNLTFGDGKNKAFLCGFSKFMTALVAQLQSSNEDLRQVTASVLRNLSWRADSESKKALRAVDAVTALTIAAVEGKKESTLKSILSALWNLSAHCSMNKVDICSVPDALAFLVKMLKYKSASNTLAVVENAGGILRNISSHIAVREDYRQILRDNGCFEILLEHLKSPSLTIVSNACGTLWNLSARCSEDQKRLWEMGAVSMLRNLVHSKHRMISMGSSAALKNLLAANPNGNVSTQLDSTARSLGFQNLPSLLVRKQRALEQEIDITLAETCDNIESNGSPVHSQKNESSEECSKLFKTNRTESKESIKSSKSDSICQKVNQIVAKQEDHSSAKIATALHESFDATVRSQSQKDHDEEFLSRYKSSMIPILATKKLNQEKSNGKERESKLIEGKVNSVVSENESKIKQTQEAKDKSRRGIPVPKTKSKSQVVCGENNSHSLKSDLKIQDKFSLTSLTMKPCLMSPSSCMSRDSETASSSILRTTLQDVNECRIMPQLSVCRNNSLVSQSQDQVSSNSDAPALNKGSLNETNCVETKAVLGSEENVKPGCDTLSGTERLYMPVSPEKVQAKFKESEANDLKNMNEKFKKPCGRVLPMGKTVASEELEKTCGPFTKISEGEHSNGKMGKNAVEEIGSSSASARVLNGNNSEKSTRRNSDVEKRLENSMSVVPNFKIGFEITHNKFLQSEANKICQEIRKYQDSETNCSMHSQISAPSCSSFLDTCDYSLFDFTSNTMDFDESESNSKLLDCLTVSPLSISNDCVSLPSLGSHRNDHVETLDLESSMISVASLASEVAENSFKLDSSEGVSTSTLKSCNGTFYGGTANLLYSTTEKNSKCFGKPLIENYDQNDDDDDDDDSLYCQESLPLDVDCVKGNRIKEAEKKLTPKERRKVTQERYRTYTIRDIKVNRAEKAPSLASKEDDVPNQEMQHASERLESVVRKLQNVVQKEFDRSTLVDRRSMHELTNAANLQHVAIPNSKSAHNLICLGPAERKELVDNAKLVALSLKMTAVQDPELIDSEISLLSNVEDDCCKTVQEIDTATYRKDHRMGLQIEVDKQRNNLSDKNKKLEMEREERLGEKEGKKDEEKKGGEEEEEEEEEEKEIKEVEEGKQEEYQEQEYTAMRRAKIAKPTEKINSDAKTSDATKSIRGGRRKLYSFGGKKSASGTVSTPNSPKATQALVYPRRYLSTTKSLPNVSKSISQCLTPLTGVQREGTFTKRKSNFSAGSNTVDVAESCRVSDSNYALTYKSTGRNKSAPSLKNASVAGRGFSNSDTKDFSDRAKTVKSNATTVNPAEKKASFNDHNMAPINNVRNIALSGKQKRNGIEIPKNLNVSPKLVSPDDKGKSKREVTSKIASLWKRVEETKEKNKNVVDRRVWIGGERNFEGNENFSLDEKEVAVVQSAGLEVPNRKLSE